jgi:putative transposase
MDHVTTSVESDQFKAKSKGRHSIHLHRYDYTQPGAYFVTICTHNQSPILGRILGGEIVLSQEGEIVMKCLDKIPHHFTNSTLDTYIIMPNHIHGIILLFEDRRVEASVKNDGILSIALRSDASPLQTIDLIPRGTKSDSLGVIVQNFKSISARKINQLHSTPGDLIWQRNYFEHIIRTEKALRTIRHDILTNPICWDRDCYNPNASAIDEDDQALWNLFREKEISEELER